jgi:hypothetical protein
MAASIEAREGQWYVRRWGREAFCVIGIDESARIIDIRDENGDVDEVDFSEWERMELEACSPPCIRDDEDNEDLDLEDAPHARAGIASSAQHARRG